MKSLDQERASYAWERVQSATREYQSLAKSLPALIMTNGLMQTLAFLSGKSTKEHKRLCEDILGWLNKVALIQKGEYQTAIREMAEGMDSLQYQRVTEEALAVLRWIRYLAQTVGR